MLPPPPPGIAHREHPIALRDDLIAFLSIVQRLAIDPDLATDLGEVTPLDVSTDNQKVAIDASRRPEYHVRVERNDTPGDMAANGERAIQHGHVAEDFAPAFDLERAAETETRTRVEQRRGFTSHV